MEMQDKDFDKLFSQKMNDFEMQPSASVWEEIDSELATGRRKKLLMPFLSVAASIVVLVTAGVFFIPRYHGAATKNTDRNSLAVKTKPEDTVVIATNASTAIAPKKIDTAERAKATYTGTAIAVVNRTMPQTQIKTPTITQVESNTNTNTTRATTPLIAEQPVLASVTPKQPEIIKAVVPDVQMAVKAQVDEPILLASNTDNNTKLPAITTPDGQQPAKVKRKAHGLGGLINMAIAKVDKRKDKFIEFTDDDDEDSNITGVNIGILKIKKEK